MSPIRGGVDNKEVVGRSIKVSRNNGTKFNTVDLSRQSPQPTRRTNDLAVIQEKFNKIKKLFRPVDRTPPLFEAQ